MYCSLIITTKPVKNLSNMIPDIKITSACFISDNNNNKVIPSKKMEEITSSQNIQIVKKEISKFLKNKGFSVFRIEAPLYSKLSQDCYKFL